jgi:hypothetical protein
VKPGDNIKGLTHFYFTQNLIEMQNNQLEPPPVEIDTETGLNKWVINDINVYAHTYEGALRVYEQIIENQ